MGNFSASETKNRDCDTEMSEQRNCKCIGNDKDYCLHKATKDKNLEEVKRIIRDETEGGTLNLLKINSCSEIPLHLACKLKGDEMVKALLGIENGTRSVDERKYKIKEQLEAKNEIFGNTPLHVAASVGNTEAVETILSVLHDPKHLISKKNKLKDTPVHNAASKGHVRILENMYMKAPKCIEEKGRFEGLPLHTACGYGHLEAVKKFLEWSGKNKSSHIKSTAVYVDLPAFTKTTESTMELDRMDKDQKEKMMMSIKNLGESAECEENSEYTPLTRACQFGRKDIVKHLLEEGAEPNLMALVKAIQGLYTDCVKLLLFTDKNEFPKDLLHTDCTPYHHYDSSVSTTPFRDLIKYMPDVAESVLHRSVEFEKFLVNSENFQIKLNYEFVDDDGEIRMRDNETEVNNNIEPERIIVEENSSTSPRDDHNSGQSNQSTQPHDDHNSPICTCTKLKFGFNKETHPLSLMIKHKREKLITHPVVAGLIHDKWKSGYGIISLVLWVIYTLYLACINALLFQLPNPRSGYCIRDNVTSQQEIATNSCSSMLSSSNKSVIDCEDTDVYDVNSSILLGLASMVIIYSAIRTFIQLYQLVISFCQACSSTKLKNKKKCSNIDCSKLCWKVYSVFKRIDFIWSLDHWIEVPLFILSLIFAAVVTCSKDGMSFCLIAWQWQIGVCVIWLSWIEFIFFSVQFRLIGVHALMFIRVTKTMLKFIPLALLLIFAFGLTFHFLLYQPELKASPYFTPGYSFLKTLSMTAGDAGSDTFFGLDINGQVQNNTHLQYLSLSTFVWLLSLLFMTILLSNLMIGLAVGDIRAIYEKAQFEKLKLQIDYILTVESQFKWILPRSMKNQSTKEFEPNKTPIKETLINELIYLLWGGVRYDSPESIKRLISGSPVAIPAKAHT